MLYLMMLESPEDKSKFEELYYSYRNLMYYIARDILHDDGLAEDAVQEAFYRLVKNFSKIGEVNCNKTKKYIVLIIRSTAIDIYRKQTGKEAVLSEEWQTADESCAEESVQDRVLQAIHELKPAYADILLMKYVQGLDNHEIAVLLKKREGAVRVSLSRAKKELEKKLAAWNLLKDKQDRGE